MYSLDLNKVSVEDFVEILKSLDLLPGRKILLTEIDELSSRLSEKNVHTLFELQRMLKRKSDYPRISSELNLSEEYLTVLNREVNSYESKPTGLEKLNIFSDIELRVLESNGIRNSKDLYLRALQKSQRDELSSATEIPLWEIQKALILCDLVRINGVGPQYATILYKMGIKGVSDYLITPSEVILEKYQEVNATEQLSKAKLGIKDVDYCKRFCMNLDKEVQISDI